MLYQNTDDGKISNLYNFQVINKTRLDYEDVRFEMVSPEGNIEIVGEIPTMKANSVLEGAFFIKIEKEDLTSRKTRVKVNVFINDELMDDATTTFLGPNN